jgi:hypothetical protein
MTQKKENLEIVNKTAVFVESVVAEDDTFDQLQPMTPEAFAQLQKLVPSIKPLATIEFSSPLIMNEDGSISVKGLDDNHVAKVSSKNPKSAMRVMRAISKARQEVYDRENNLIIDQEKANEVADKFIMEISKNEALMRLFHDLVKVNPRLDFLRLQPTGNPQKPSLAISTDSEKDIKTLNPLTGNVVDKIMKRTANSFECAEKDILNHFANKYSKKS